MTGIFFDGQPKLNPPGREEKDRARAVAEILQWLEQAACGDDVAAALVGAMSRVDDCGFGLNRVLPIINPVQHDELLAAVARAHASAGECLLHWNTPGQIDNGMEALAAQVMLWAETGEQRAARDGDHVSDIHARARIFRNSVHNLSLAEGMGRRAHKRRDGRIQELSARAHGNQRRA